MDIDYCDWDRTFGGSGDDIARSVQQTTDGGYIIVGGTGPIGATNAWLIKTDSTGDKLWDRTFGGLEHGDAVSVQQTTDGGYIIAGERFSGALLADACLIKTDANGN